MTTEINLLPWREKLRERRKKQFFAMLGASVAGGAVLAGALFWHFSMLADGQRARNAYLEDKIAVAEKQIEAIKDLDTEKQRLIGRKDVITSLQSNRARVVHLFETLSRATPDGIMLTLVKQSPEGMLIEGRAQSNTRVSNYMRSLEASGWMQNPDLDIIEASEPAPGLEDFPYLFKLSVGLAKLEDVVAAQANATAAGAPDPLQMQTETADPAVPADALIPLQAAPTPGNVSDEGATEAESQAANNNAPPEFAPDVTTLSRLEDSAPPPEAPEPTAETPTQAPPPPIPNKETR